MNERMLELAEQAGYKPLPGFDFANSLEETYLKKFAELIIRECVGLCDQAAEENKRMYDTVNETGELGPALVTMGGRAQAEKLSKQIKKHFGVKE